MTPKSVMFNFALLAVMALANGAMARPEGSAAMSTLLAGNVRQIQATLKEALPLYMSAAKSANQDHGHNYGKLSVVHLILIIGKVLAPLVGAIIEPLLINIAKGITWAITYSLATGFDKPPSYEHFVPALEHHGGGGYDDGEYGDYESHKPVAYTLKELPGLALQLSTEVLSESSSAGPQAAERAEAMRTVERKLVGLLLQPSQNSSTVQ